MSIKKIVLGALIVSASAAVLCGCNGKEKETASEQQQYHAYEFMTQTDRVDLVGSMYTSNMITRDGYAMYSYVVTDPEYADYFDENKHVRVLDEYEGLTEEVHSSLAEKSDCPRNMRTSMYLCAKNRTNLTADGMKILNFNENDPRQVAQQVKVEDMNDKNIRCLVQNYFIDVDGTVLSDKISDKYFGGADKLELSEEQLGWAKAAYEDKLGMEMDYTEFIEKYYNLLTDEQMQVWRDIWGVEY